MIVVCELVELYSLKNLLEISKLARATYFYQKSRLDYKKSKDREILEQIRELFDKNYHKYGVRRITIALKSRGYSINHKRVERIMRENNIAGKINKRKYRSYKGDVGRIADNILNRDFKTERPYQKVGTDVTQFITKYGKLYLSPIIDFHTREILSYDLSESPNLDQIRRMMTKLKNNHGKHINGCIIHSDQGWQYQMRYYRKSIEENQMIQSMSRKGNCLDNSPTENFFGRLKEEMYYDNENDFKSLEHLKAEIHKYINYYNNERIVTNLRTSPVKCRILSCKN